MWGVVAIIILVLLLVLFLQRDSHVPVQATPVFEPRSSADLAKAAIEAEKARADEELSGQFVNTMAAAEVPEDFPRKSIGTCPYSKPMSSDLPMCNVPRCMAISDQNMRLVPLAMSV